MPTILATTSSFGSASPQAAENVREAGYELVTNPHGRKLTEDELIELMTTHQPTGLLAGTEPVTARAMDAAKDTLQAIARIGVGWDNVDHDEAAKLGLPVSRTVGVLDQPVAELTLGFMLSALRHMALHDREIRTSTWKKHMGALLAGKTVGIVGMGAIGRRVAELVVAFGANVIFSDICTVEATCGLQCEFPDLLNQADIITLHASGSGCIVDKTALASMKRGVILINTARGGLIDESALADGLADGHIGHACLDVFESEPYSGPLAKLPNTTLTSHIGSYALEARVEMELMAVDNLLADLEKGDG